MEYKFVGGPHGATATVEGKEVGEVVTLSKETAETLISVGFQLEEVGSSGDKDK
jgi:hypothetical protein